MTEPTTHYRRTFLRRGGHGARALWTLSLTELMSRRAVRLTGNLEPIRPDWTRA